MSKTIKNSFYDKLTFESLLEAHNRAKKNKTTKLEVLKFEFNLENEITSIIDDLKKDKYALGNYRVYTIYEPKERIIKCLPYRDRVVQQWYIYEFIKPYIVPRLINTCCACIDNRGTHYAVNLTEKYMKKMKNKYHNYYILKLDIKKYFYNIDKYLLYDIMKKYITDKKLLYLTKIFIFDDESTKGIPIGNYTSQYFANIYLSILDKYIKEELKVKYYVRYMDDMVILLSSKEECHFIMKKITIFLKDKLLLELNHKSRYYPHQMGINFCGYRIFDDYRLIRNSSKKMIKKKIKNWHKDKINNSLNKQYLIASFNSWQAHISHANSYRIHQKMLNEIKEILR